MTPHIVYMVTQPVSAELLLKGQLRFFRENGWEVSVISSPGKGLARVAEREGVRTIGIRMDRAIRPFQDVWALVRLYRALRRLKPQIVNASTPKAGFLGMMAAWLARVPVRIYTLRGLRLETTRGPRKLLLWCAERMVSACAHRIVCVSPSLAELYLNLGLAAEHKVRVPTPGSSNGVDVGRFRVSSDDRKKAKVRERLGIPTDAAVIGFVGRLTKDKGSRELLVAFERVLESLPNTWLLWVGDFETEDRPSSHVVHRIRNHPQTVVTGFVSDTESYYPTMDVLAFPSYREGFPNVPLEAAAATLPVVGFRGTGTIDAVQDGVTGLLVPMGDGRALANSISRYLGDPELRRRHGGAAHQRAKEEFSPQRVWNGLEKIFANELRATVTPPSPRTPRSKRVVDIVVAGLGLVLSTPILLLTAAAIYIDMGSPVFFRQKRPGLKGGAFDILKFRTMKVGSRPDEVRLTTLGRFLRSTSLDEIPELWNVLRGDMSLVGPRPLLTSYLPLYSPEQARRHEVRPGITGWAQVHGRNALTWDKKLEADVWYVDHWSPWLDTKILWRTLFHVVTRQGISAEGHATMPEFKGSVE